MFRKLLKFFSIKQKTLTHKEKFAMWERDYEFWSFYRSIRGDVCHFFDTIERFFYWGWKLRHNYDWDSAGIYDMILFKLDRMIPIFEDSQYHSYSKKFVNRMKEVRDLAKRLKQGDYNQYHDSFEEKWGRQTWNTESIKEGQITRICFNEPPSVNDTNLEKYHSEFKKAMTDDYNAEIADRKLFFELLNKYIQKWWD